MTQDPKPQMSRQGIEANISYYEARLHTAHDNWERELQNLQYWMDELDKVSEH